MSEFRFKQFVVDDAGCGMKVGTDSVLLGAWTHIGDARYVIDMGSGSGLLALMVAQRASHANITAIESDISAYRASIQNFEASPWADRIEAINADILEYTPSVKPDLLICNPPYFDNGLISPTATRATARHTQGQFGPLQAIKIASQWLGEGGSLAMVTPAQYAESIIYEAEMHHMHLWRRCNVHTVATKPPIRTLCQITTDRSLTPQSTEIILRNGDSSYTKQYKSLTKDFYLNF